MICKKKVSSELESAIELLEMKFDRYKACDGLNTKWQRCLKSTEYLYYCIALHFVKLSNGIWKGSFIVKP